MTSFPTNPTTGKHRVNDGHGTTNKLLRTRLQQAIRQQDYPTALKVLTCFIHHEPHNSSHYSNRGLIYSYCEQWLQAMADYNQALYLDPNEDRTYANRAKCRVTLGDWNAAIADYDCAIAINPYNINARIHQGILFRKLRLYDDAIVCFGLALFIGKLSAHIYAERGRTYQLDGHWNCAVGDYQRALEILEQSPSAALTGQIKTWVAEFSVNQ